MKSNRGFLIGVIVLVVVGLAAVVAVQTGVFDRGIEPLANLGSGTSETAKPEPVEQRPLAEALGVSDDEMVEVGGVQRPKRDVAFESNAGAEESVPEDKTSKKSLLRNSGKAPAIPKDANPQVAQLHEELSADDGGPLAARSSLFAPEPFDSKIYDADKEKWLSQIRPGRAFQPAQPGPDVKPIGTKTQSFQNIVLGEKVVLEVKAEPGSPVTFYTPQVGEFENRLTTQSVAADENGIGVGHTCSLLTQPLRRMTVTNTSSTKTCSGLVTTLPDESDSLTER